MGAMGVQSFQQNRTCLAVKIASRDLASVKLTTCKLSLCHVFPPLSSDKTVVLSTSGTMGRVLYCDAFMMQLKFYNCHMKRSEIQMVLPNSSAAEVNSLNLGLSCRAIFNEWPGYNKAIVHQA